MLWYFALFLTLIPLAAGSQRGVQVRPRERGREALGRPLAALQSEPQARVPLDRRRERRGRLAPPRPRFFRSAQNAQQLKQPISYALKISVRAFVYVVMSVLS